MAMEKADINICPCCNKQFDITFMNRKEYAWRIKETLYCSYTCYSKEFDKRGWKAFRYNSKPIESGEAYSKQATINYKLFR